MILISLAFPTKYCKHFISNYVRALTSLMDGFSIYLFLSFIPHFGCRLKSSLFVLSGILQAKRTRLINSGSGLNCHAYIASSTKANLWCRSQQYWRSCTIKTKLLDAILKEVQWSKQPAKILYILSFEDAWPPAHRLNSQKSYCAKKKYLASLVHLSCI